MRLAIRLGERSRGRTWPNPAVGCVIVRDGRIVARGWTQPGGRPHAEAAALAQAGTAAQGATVYVSLEPCAHYGRTPPCAEALARAGVARVVTAIGDPDPRVAGQGHAILRAAGIAVAENVETALAARSHRGFLTRITEGRPMVTLKLAASLDGRIALTSGESRWITGPEARRLVHLMRADHDAVLIGGGTARADDPDLTVRGLGVMPQPVRVVASRRLSLPPEGRLARSAREVPLWLLHDPDAAGEREDWIARGARPLAVAAGPEGLDPAAMLAVLAGEGITRVFCEGGGRLAAALLNAGLVDELAVFSAGFAIGGDGLAAVAAMGLPALSAARRFDLAELRAVGGDTLSLWSRG